MRLQLILDQIIHPSQTGFVKGKNISENTLKLLSMMDFCNENHTSAIVVSFNFYKAFDSVEWKAIYTVLEQFGVGTYFLNLIKTLYNDIFSTVMNNRYWGDWFSLTRSTRQGCPASALIFLTVAEALGLKIRQSIEIKGLEILNVEYKSVQYADDIWIILEPKEENINKALQIMEDFYQFSGLNINFEKTKAFKLGPIRESEAKYYTIKKIVWTNKPIKILGIWFHPNYNLMQKVNFEEKLDKIKDLVELWKKRKLTLMGKIAIINSLVISQFNYPLASLTTPSDHFFKTFKNIIMEFL